MNIKFDNNVEEAITALKLVYCVQDTIEDLRKWLKEYEGEHGGASVAELIVRWMQAHAEDEVK